MSFSPLKPPVRATNESIGVRGIAVLIAVQRRDEGSIVRQRPIAGRCGAGWPAGDAMLCLVCALGYQPLEAAPRDSGERTVDRRFPRMRRDRGQPVSLTLGADPLAVVPGDPCPTTLLLTFSCRDVRREALLGVVEEHAPHAAVGRHTVEGGGSGE